MWWVDEPSATNPSTTRGPRAGREPDFTSSTPMGVLFLPTLGFDRAGYRVKALGYGSWAELVCLSGKAKDEEDKRRERKF